MKVRHPRVKQMLNKLDVSHCMKYLLSVLIIFTLIAPAVASPGAGLVYYSESILVDSNQEFCVNYGLYNPFDVDSQIPLTADGEIAEFVIDSNYKLVPADTRRTEAYDADICYRAPELRKKVCRIPFILCAYTCENTETIYEGQVLASPESSAALGGSGSSVGMSIAAPFTLLVRCQNIEYNYWPIIFIVASVVILVLIYILIKLLKKLQEKKEKQRREDYWKRYRSPPKPPQQPQQPTSQYTPNTQQYYRPRQ